MFQHRRFWLGALALTLAASLAPASARAAETDKLLPNDTEIYLNVNIRQILDSELVKKHGLAPLKAVMQREPNVQNVLTTLGFDPLKDLTSMTAAGPGGTDPEKGLFIVHGKFDKAKFQKQAEEAAKGGDIKIGKIGDHTLWEVTPPGLPQSFYVVLADQNTILIAGGKGSLSTALDKLAGKKKTALNKDMQALVEKAGTDRSLSFIALTRALAKSLEEVPVPVPNIDQVIDALKELDSVSAGLTIADDVKFQLAIMAKKAETAKTLALQAQKGLAFGRLMVATQVKNNPGLAPVVEILKSMKVKADDKAVNIEGMVSGDVIEKAIKNRPNKPKD
jgi:hypothetical protein